MRQLLLGLVVLLATVPVAAAAQLDDTVAALRSSPVYVAPGAKPTLDDAGQAQVRAAIGRAGTPVYVAVLPASALDETGGDADEFVRRLGNAEQEPGTYAVVAGGKFRAASTRLKRGAGRRSGHRGLRRPRQGRAGADARGLRRPRRRRPRTARTAAAARRRAAAAAASRSSRC